METVWEDEDGRIFSKVVDEAQFDAVTSLLAGVCSAGVVSLDTDGQRPLVTAVPPVKIIDVDPARRRIVLSRLQTLASSRENQPHV